MGTIVDNNIPKIIVPAVEDSTIKIHAAVLSTVNSDDNMEINDVDKKDTSDDLLSAEITVENTKSIEDTEEDLDHVKPVFEGKKFKTKLVSLSDKEDDFEEVEHNNELKETRKNISSAMTAKDAEVQRREIHSVSQKRLRESRLSLPYHKSKQHTLQEFLQKRPKITEPVVLQDLKQLNVVDAIKIASERTEQLSKSMEERNKKLEKFYNASSDSESNEDEEINENEQMMELILINNNNNNNNKESFHKDVNSEENTINDKPMNTLQRIFDELHLDFNQVKNDLIRSFLQPSKLINDTKSSFDNDCETELISECEVNRIIETLDNHSLGIKDPLSIDGTDHLTSELPYLSDLQLNNLVEKYNSTTTNCFESKCFAPPLDNDEDEIQNSVGRNQPMKNKFNIDLKNTQPRLSGGPNQWIDLNVDVKINEDDGVNNLLNRMIKHTSAKKSSCAKPIQISVVTVDSGKMKEEKLTLPLSGNNEEEYNLPEKPGSKLFRLREDLRERITKKRTLEWERKQKETKELLGHFDSKKSEDEEDIYEDEKDDFCDLDHDNRSEKEDDVDEEEEEDVEINDYKDSKQKLPKSDFIDEEAEESEMEDSYSEDDDGDDEADDNEEQLRNNKQRHKLRRIQLPPTTDSSDSEDEQTENNNNNNLNIASQELFETQQKNENNLDELVLAQPIPNTPKSEVKINEFSHSTENLLSSISSPSILPSLLSPSKLEEETSKFGLQELPELECDKYTPKHLFSPKTVNTQDNLNELMDLCSGKFVDDNPKNTPICSSLNSDFTSSKLVTPFSDSNVITERITDQQDINSSEKEMRLVLSDEESNSELKKLTVESNTDSPKPIINEKWFLADSSDEEDKHKQILNKKKQRVLQFSDEENSDNGSEHESEDGMETNENDRNDKNVFIDYDSEENEIIVDQTTQAKDFFDVEAELSEEDRDIASADEDEAGLDFMEEEDGDADKLNQNKVRRELEKIHMQEVLDQDKREVRLLQELFLEDGDLHSDRGRQRQFKWKNIKDINLTNDENKEPPDELETHTEDLEEIEREEQSRRQRHEREIFLREQKDKVNRTEDIEITSDVLKLSTIRTISITPLRKCTSSANSSIEKKTSENILNIKKPLGLMNKKGSFLNRGESTLTRLAANVKEANEHHIISSTKNSRKFVFQTMDSSFDKQNNNDSDNENNDKNIVKNSTNQFRGKRKPKTDIDHGTPLMIKKLRVIDTLQKKVNPRSKKLFSNV